MARVHLEYRRRRGSVQPTTPLAGIHDERVPACLHLLLMRVAVHDDVMRKNRTLVHISDIVYEQHSRAADVEAVRRLEELHAKGRLGSRDQSFSIAIVLPEDAGQRHMSDSNASTDSGLIPCSASFARETSSG